MTYKKLNNSLFFQGLKLNSFLAIFTTILKFLSVFFLVYYLSPNEIGVYGIALALFGILSLINSLGFSSYLVHKEKITEEELWTTNSIRSFTFLVVSVFMFLFSQEFSNIFGDSRIEPLIKLLSLVNIIRIFSFAPATMLYKNLKFKTRTLILSIKSLTEASSLIIFLTLGYSYYSPVFAILASEIFGLIAFNFFNPLIPKFIIKITIFKSLLSYGYGLFLSKIVEMTFSLDRLVIGYYFGLEILGIYIIAIRIPNIIVSLIQIVNEQVLFISLSSLKENSEMNLLMNKYFLLFCTLALPSTLGIISISDSLVLLIFGKEWQMSIILMQIFSFCILSSPLLSILKIYLRSSGDTIYLFYSTLFQAIIQLLGLSVSVYFLTIEGIIATIVISQLLSTIYLFINIKNISISKSSVNIFFKIFFASLSMFLAIIFYSFFYYNLSYLFLLCEIILGIIVFCSLIYFSLGYKSITKLFQIIDS